MVTAIAEPDVSKFYVSPNIFQLNRMDSGQLEIEEKMRSTDALA